MAELRLCSIPDCDKPSRRRGWCEAHYSRWRKHGDPTGRRKIISKPICRAAGCSNISQSARSGLCPTHFYRFKRHGGFEAIRVEPGSTAKFIDKVAIPYSGDECLLWPYYKDKDGYGKAFYNKKSIKASRIVCILYNGKPPSDTHEAAHSCGNRGCVNPKHLRWATSKENSQDMAMHGSVPRGERHQNAKLTNTDVLEIRLLYGTITQKELATRYGVCASTIYNVVTGRYWKDLSW